MYWQGLGKKAVTNLARWDRGAHAQRGGLLQSQAILQCASKRCGRHAARLSVCKVVVEATTQNGYKSRKLKRGCDASWHS